MEIERLPLGHSLADKHRAAELKWRGKPPGLPPQMSTEFMAKLKAGNTIRKLTGGGESGPALVSRERFIKHCELHPIWAAEARRISALNLSRARSARGRNLTHCPRGHPFSGQTLRGRRAGIMSGKRIAPRVVGFDKFGLYRRLNPSFDRFVIAATANSNSKGQQRRWQ